MSDLFENHIVAAQMLMFASEDIDKKCSTLM